MFTFVQPNPSRLRVWHSLARLTAVLCCLAVLSACAVSSGQRVRDVAERRGFTETTARGEGFAHTVFGNNIPVEADGVLHIYLEGDGSPWLMGRFVASDPTPWNPLMLRLMAKDRQPAFYVGRPCYNGFAQAAGCHPDLWTRDRHADVVVRAMQSVIEQLYAQSGASAIYLFGHSGGGAMAMLLAPRLMAVTRVVTLAGNLNLDGWTRLHRYSPLSGSLDPATQPVLRAGIRQWHFAGEQDRNIPPDLVVPTVQRQPNAALYVMDGFSHGEGWEKVWGRILGSLDQGLNSPDLGPFPHAVWDSTAPSAVTAEPALSFPGSAE